MNPTADQEAIERMTQKILESPKYRNLNIPADCVRDLVQREINVQVSPKTAEKKAKEKLHQIIAPYLGDPDYPSAGMELQQAAAEGKAALRSWCEKQLLSHSSTKERFPVMESFYQKILDRIGSPKTVLDLACAMNPFAFPWMGLPDSTRYHAYDLHAPRIHLIMHFSQPGGWNLWQKSTTFYCMFRRLKRRLLFSSKKRIALKTAEKAVIRDSFSSCAVNGLSSHCLQKT